MSEWVSHADEGVEAVAHQILDVLRQAEPVGLLNDYSREQEQKLCIISSYVIHVL